MTRMALKAILRSQFTPRFLPGLALWLDASAIGGLADGAAVATWSDLSGIGNDAAQANGAKQPLSRLTAGINGYPSVKFDASNDFLACAALTKTIIPTTADVTMAVVFQLAALGNQSLLYLGNSTAFAPNFHFVGIQYVSGVGLVFNNYDDSEHRAVSNAALVAGTAYIAVGVRESSVNKLYLNGTLQTTAPASGTPNVSASATLNIGSDQGITGFTGAYISDVIVVPNALTTSTVAKLSRYLGQRRGIATT